MNMGCQQGNLRYQGSANQREVQTGIVVWDTAFVDHPDVDTCPVQVAKIAVTGKL